MQNIPSVDLRDFLSDDPVRKQKFVNEIGKAYEEIGFVALKGHFLSDELAGTLYEEVRNFLTFRLIPRKNMRFRESEDKEGTFPSEKNPQKEELPGILKSFGILDNMLKMTKHLNKPILKM